MSARALRFDFAQLDMDEGRARTRWSMSASAVIHVLLLLWIVFGHPAARQALALTEITLLSPGEAEAAGEPAPAPRANAAVATPGVAVASTEDIHFRREARGSIEPTPESDAAAVDRLNARLAAIQNTTPAPLASTSALGAPNAMWGPPATAVGPGGSGGSPIPLHRGGGTGASPIALSRGGQGSAPLLAGMPGTGAGTAGAPAAQAGGDVSARRALAGASLAGPIADRGILHYVKPVYPEWAKRDAVEGAVTLYFVVRSDGTVKENVLVQKTAGFAEFDENAQAALLEWRFEPLRGGRTGEQWGTITFHYRLRGA
jgi:TonB family protein